MLDAACASVQPLPVPVVVLVVSSGRPTSTCPAVVLLSPTGSVISSYCTYMYGMRHVRHCILLPRLSPRSRSRCRSRPRAMAPRARVRVARHGARSIDRLIFESIESLNQRTFRRPCGISFCSPKTQNSTFENNGAIIKRNHGDSKESHEKNNSRRSPLFRRHCMYSGSRCGRWRY